MPSLSDRLKSLGVQVGTNQIPPTEPAQYRPFEIHTVLPGNWWPTPYGDVFYVETRYQSDFKAGQIPLKPKAPLEIIAAWAKEPELVNLKLDQFGFIDTETTGLASGSGTYAFLIGAGRFEGDEFRLVQFFLRDPAEELAQLAALEAFLAPCKAIVSYNGKSFDMPLLNARYITNGQPAPLTDICQLDLLHLARRLWKARLPSRTLGDLEVNILGTQRTENDVPGWMIAKLYFDYLQTGDARPLRGVFYHNEMDVVSMAALLNYMATIVSDPLQASVAHGLDIISIGKLYADLGELDKAAQIYQLGLQHEDVVGAAYRAASQQLSFIHKKRGNFKAAVALWQRAAQNQEVYAHIELAKYYEHHAKKLSAAQYWTENAIRIVSQPNTHPLEREQWLPALEHRQNRLQTKLNHQNQAKPQ